MISRHSKRPGVRPDPSVSSAPYAPPPKQKVFADRAIRSQLSGA